MTQNITLRRPDDWHLHLRDGAMLKGVLPETARHFARAIIMPNLVPPGVTGAQAAAYRERILAAGFKVAEIGNSECAKLDGGMSCLSLRFTPKAKSG